MKHVATVAVVSLLLAGSLSGQAPKRALTIEDYYRIKTIGDAQISPNGQWVAFFAGSKLKKISVTGGAAVALCDADAGNQRGGIWAGDGTIVFQPIGTNGGYLMRVSETGGKPEPLRTQVVLTTAGLSVLRQPRTRR